MSSDQLGLEAQIASMAEQCRRVYLDWELAVKERDEAVIQRDRWKKLADQYAVTKLPEPNSWFCPGGCDCSCCYGHPDKDCHCFTYPCNCGGGFADHHTAEADQ